MVSRIKKKSHSFCDSLNLSMRKITSLECPSTDKLHDAYGCSCYISGMNNDCPFYPSLQHSYIKHNNHNPVNSETKRYSNSVLHYFIKSLANSSISGISNSISTKNVIGKIIWIVVFVGCVSGFLYQASHFYHLYQSNPTVVQIEVENDGEVDFPAITVCNTNR